MCNFFSCNSDGKGNIFYLKAAERKKLLKENPEQSPDSHAYIAKHFGLIEDKCNKYEYNPITKVFVIDQLNTTDDSEQVKALCSKLDFERIVPELIVKPIINPKFVIRKSLKPTKRELKLLEEWIRTWNSVGGFLVGNSVGGLVGGFLVGGYVESFFKLENPRFSSVTKLWEAGLVPSFNGKVWRLHAGEKMEIVYTREAK